MSKEKLLKKLNDFLDETECGMLLMHGCRLSVADVEEIIMRLEDANSGKFIEPDGIIKIVMEKEGVL